MFHIGVPGVRRLGSLLAIAAASNAVRSILGLPPTAS